MAADSEQRAWAFEELKGVCNVIIPSFTADLAHINEPAIRHDVRRNIDLGFRGTLLVSEVGTTIDEYVQFVEIAASENDGAMILIHHASFNTLEENIEAIKRAEAAGASMALLSYPPTFYPKDDDEIYHYSRSVCDATSMGIMLFPVPLWGFERVHPASLSMDLMGRLIDDCPNIVSIKAEGGYPSITGFAETWNRFGDRVVVTFPIEQHAIGLASLVPMQVIATSNTEYYGDSVPHMMRCLLDGRREEAMKRFWQIAPARKANEAAGAIGNFNIVHRMVWKYQAWLAGFNGGPLRMPTSRIAPWQMSMLRQGLIDSGIAVTDDTDEQFFVGRNPA